MTNDVATNAIPGKPVQNGFAVTAVTKTGDFQTLAPPVDAESASVGAYQADLSGRLSPQAHGATVVATQ
jgi:hypothetical protein